MNQFRSIRSSLAAAAILSLALVMGCGGRDYSETSDSNPGPRDWKITPQDFDKAASKLTEQMLMAPVVQNRLTAMTRNGRLPLLKISRLRNNTTQHFDAVEYVVTPVKQVLINSGKVICFSEDQGTADLARVKEFLKGRSPDLPDFTLYGVITQARNSDTRTEQFAYTFQLTLADDANNEVWIGRTRITKQSN